MYKEFHDILNKSMSDVDINCYKEDFWKEETELFSKDISKTIDFVLNECSDIEFTWLGEIFSDIVEKTNSKEFVDAIKARYAKIKPGVDVIGTESDIECAESALKEK